jgi:DNA-binding transcriptional MerR regulator
MKKRVFTDRQLAIIELIIEKKSSGEKELTLDEVVELCKSKDLFRKAGVDSYRPTALATMNTLIHDLNSMGVKITKVKRIGRGAKTVFEV